MFDDIVSSFQECWVYEGESTGQRTPGESAMKKPNREQSSSISLVA